MKLQYGETAVVTKANVQQIVRQNNKTMRCKRNTKQIFTRIWQNSDTEENRPKIIQKKMTDKQQTFGIGKVL